MTYQEEECPTCGENMQVDTTGLTDLLSKYKKQLSNIKEVNKKVLELLINAKSDYGQDDSIYNEHFDYDLCKEAMDLLKQTLEDK